MTTQLESEPQQKGELSPLIDGIIQDAKQLLAQQLTLFQVELKNDLRRSMEASIPLALGVVFLLAALITLATSAGFLLNWLWPDLPLWGSFGIVGILITGAGIALVMAGIQKFKTMNPPGEKSVEGLKENLVWKTKT